MEVVFRIRRLDLRRALRELGVNRGAHRNDDKITILVSAYAATFRAPGTESEYPVDGVSPGVAQLPMAVLNRIADILTGKEPELCISDGTIMCGKASVKHELIKIGEIPNLRVRVPIDPSLFDLIVIGRILGDDLIAEQGLESRLNAATERLNHAISAASQQLAPFGISDSALRALVESAIDGAKEKIRRGVYS